VAAKNAPAPVHEIGCDTEIRAFLTGAPGKRRSRLAL
jgi:hypothetical protein